MMRSKLLSSPRPHRPARLLALALVLDLTALLPAHAVEPPTGDWNFRALLDDKPIGNHRFSVSGQGDQRQVVSEADFSVKVLGITAYRYHHQAKEEWRGECLSALTARTDDDGKASSVRAEAEGDTLEIKATAGSSTPKGCVMSFAYWNPAIQTQTQLLNAQTGKLENVKVVRAGTGTVEVRGKPVSATRWRITGPEAPIDVWYSAQGDWVGLDSTVAGGRRLSYRLE